MNKKKNEDNSFLILFDLLVKQIKKTEIAFWMIQSPTLWMLYQSIEIGNDSVLEFLFGYVNAPHHSSSFDEGQFVGRKPLLCFHGCFCVVLMFTDINMFPAYLVFFCVVRCAFSFYLCACSTYSCDISFSCLHIGSCIFYYWLSKRICILQVKLKCFNDWSYESV